MPQPRQQQRQQQVAPPPEQSARNIDQKFPFEDVRQQADELWGKDDEGRRDTVLTKALFKQLEPLLYTPTPPEYIEHRASGQGNPFATTGVKTTQIQFDLMNAVLGSAHWRYLLHYTQQGTLCKAVIVVGNSLEWCRLDDDGNLLNHTVVDLGLPEPVLLAMVEKDGVSLVDFYREADVITFVEGYGGWKSKATWDTFKAAETNAMKRAFARLGPGADVYRVDYDQDTLALLRGEESPETQFDPKAQGSATRAPARRPAQQQAAEQAQQQAQAAAEQREPTLTDEEAQAALEKLLAEEATVQVGSDTVDLQALRKEAYDLIQQIPEENRPALPKLYTLINSRKDDPRQLADLMQRTRNAIGGDA